MYSEIELILLIKVNSEGEIPKSDLCNYFAAHKSIEFKACYLNFLVLNQLRYTIQIHFQKF